MQFHDYLKKYILKPAGMFNTFFPKNIFYDYTNKEKKNLSVTHWLPHLYSDNIERTDTVTFAKEYWHSYNFQGFGEIVSTTGDLLKYDQALHNGKLLDEATLVEAFTPIKLINGKINPLNYGLGWIVKQDSKYGKLVMHGGGVPGIRSFLLRNITKNQTIILIDNTQNEVGDIANDILKIVNGQDVKTPGKSIAKIFARTMINTGIEHAKAVVNELKKDLESYSYNENEFNELGYDFLENNRNSEALEVFKFNTELFPESWNVYDSYAEALLENGKTDEAIKMYRKSIELNPDNQAGIRVLERLLK